MGKRAARPSAPASRDAHEAQDAAVAELDERDAEIDALDRHQLMVRAAKLGDHPDVAMAARLVAAGYVERGWYFQALELYAEARGIIERAYGPTHPEVIAIDEEIRELEAKAAETDQKV